MINQVITNIQNDLLGILDENQMKLLSEVLTKHLLPLQSATAESKNEKSDMLPVFIAAKRVEGYAMVNQNNVKESHRKFIG